MKNYLKMEWMFLGVSVVTGLNWLMHPFMLVPTLRGLGLAIVYICISLLTKKTKFPISAVWLLLAVIVSMCIISGFQLNTEMRVMSSIFCFFVSLFMAWQQYVLKMKRTKM